MMIKSSSKINYKHKDVVENLEKAYFENLRMFDKTHYVTIGLEDGFDEPQLIAYVPSRKYWEKTMPRKIEDIDIHYREPPVTMIADCSYCQTCNPCPPQVDSAYSGKYRPIRGGSYGCAGTITTPVVKYYGGNVVKIMYLIPRHMALWNPADQSDYFSPGSSYVGSQQIPWAPFKWEDDYAYFDSSLDHSAQPGTREMFDRDFLDAKLVDGTEVWYSQDMPDPPLGATVYKYGIMTGKTQGTMQSYVYTNGQLFGYKTTAPVRNGDSGSPLYWYDPVDKWYGLVGMLNLMDCNSGASSIGCPGWFLSMRYILIKENLQQWFP